MFCLNDLANSPKPRQIIHFVPGKSILFVTVIFLAVSIVLFQGCKEKNGDKKISSKERMKSVIDINISLIDIYSMLNGDGDDDERIWETPVNNWIYGDVTSDDAYKGTTPDDHPDALKIETYDWTPDNKFLAARWHSLYKAIGKCNSVLQMIDEKLGPDDGKGKQLAAEARFLRGHFYFQAKNLWGHVPWVDEKTNPDDSGNARDIRPMIESDFRYAIQYLPDSQMAPGRVTSWAAKAYLAKSCMYRHDYKSAKVILDDIIENGPYALEDCYSDNFSKAAMKYRESVFNAEYIVEDNRAETSVRNLEETTEALEGGPKEYCAYHQPSQNLVNAFKTGPDGLPLLNNFNDSDVKNDEGIPSDRPFTPYKGNLDPRLDFTVGRRGISFLDYGIHPGMDWITDQAFAGPYSMKKYILSHADKNTAAMSSSWAEGANSKAYRVIRFANILLWRAEIAAEENELGLALELVNRIRERAKSGCRLLNDQGKPAAHYVTGLYDSFPDREFAIRAVRFETRLETGMEGNRFFDLRRWGILEKTINDYLATESLTRPYLKGVRLTPGKNEHFPLPASVLAKYPGMKQNAGY